jgi:alpha-1,2-glucosyltransferase
MLYIWPYVAFFSAPLLVGTLLRPLVPFLPMRLQTACRDHLKASMLGFPRLLTTGLFMACGFLAVHFNTIIHPYTLADNRHYVFYVFKMLRLYPALKYLATPAYYTCAWLTVQTLSSPPTPMSPVGKRRPGEKTKTSLSKDMADRQPCQISFVIIWLATTALSVVTAPLVEPRYFIIPWIVWRLHVPCGRNMNSRNRYDIRMILETMWLLAINAAVSYTFLFRTFTWSSEPGNLQRFIW